jgi:hypothetical protein
MFSFPKTRNPGPKKAKERLTSSMLSHLMLLPILATSVAATALAGERWSFSAGGTELEFVWVPLDAPEGAKRVEIGDFSGKHPKERRRIASIYGAVRAEWKTGILPGQDGGDRGAMGGRDG